MKLLINIENYLTKPKLFIFGLDVALEVLLRILYPQSFIGNSNKCTIRNNKLRMKKCYNEFVAAGCRKFSQISAKRDAGATHTTQITFNYI